MVVMEFIIPLLLIAVSALFIWGLIAFLGRSAGVQKKPVGKSPALFDRMSEDDAAAAAQRLDEEAHAQVYRHLAVGRLAQAAEVYHKAAGVGRFEAFVDVHALYQFPQQPGATPVEDAAGSDPFVPDDVAEQEVTDLTAPEECL